MDKNTFARGYAERSGTTVEYLRQHGRVAVPCECGDETCEGWQMAHVGECVMPDYENARQTLRFAVLDGMTKRAHLTGLKMDQSSAMIVEDIVSTLLEQPFRWALKVIGEEPSDV